MEPFPIDIDPEQIVRWMRAETNTAPAPFRISARRTREVRRIPLRGEYRLGDQEREDLHETATIATLEIAPSHASDGWLLSVVVEDEIGPQVFGGAFGRDEEQEIDLDTFYRVFTRPERGCASVVAEAEDPAARARLAGLIERIETNRHAPQSPGPGRTAG